MKTRMSVLFSVLAVAMASSATYGADTHYLSQAEPPASHPVLFAKDIVSVKDRWEEKISFSLKEGDMFYGAHPKKNYRLPRLMHAKFDGKKWSQATEFPLTKDTKAAWPILSPDGKKLFLEQQPGKIVYSEKSKGKWSKLQQLSFDIEAKTGLGLAQITLDNTFYFYSRDEHIVYSSQYKNGQYSKPKPLSFMINPAVEFFVSPNNDFIIFQPIHWGIPLHISFRNDAGNWSLPISLKTYFKDWDAIGYGPYISADGKYLFIGMGDDKVYPGSSGIGGDIYWVKTDFVEALRKDSKTH